MSNHNCFVELNGQIEACRLCPRLVAYREEVARVKRRAFKDQPYWGKPVPGFGDENARVLVVGLAPGAHGSNRTGRMFTGDESGKFLYGALYRQGFASSPFAKYREDGLILNNLYITAVGRCAPPDNKPTPQELKNCQPYLLQEMELLENLQGVVALGKIAFDAMMKILPTRKIMLPNVSFGHMAFSQDQTNGFWLLGSYHPSRQNTQTGRLTVAMFDEVWAKVNFLINQP
ncbi:MAG: uracil-DNA glycosylase [Anaerolineaceae bacterium]